MSQFKKLLIVALVLSSGFLHTAIAQEDDEGDTITYPTGDDGTVHNPTGDDDPIYED